MSAKHKTETPSGFVFEADFSDEEIERRTSEVVRRACGQRGTFDLETGQPFEGPQLSEAELRQRGYLD